MTWLQDRGYAWCDRRAIQSHVQIWQTLEGAPFLRAEDRAEAYDVLAADQAEVPYDDPAWGIRPAGIPVLGMVGDGRPSQAVPSATADCVLPPIMGGDEYFVPTDADLAEMAEHFAWLDAVEVEIERRRPWACDDSRATGHERSEW